jgi:hypothetical protein
MDKISDDKLIEAYIDTPEKNNWYQNAFQKYNVNGIDKLAWHWSWWAFFGGVFFLLYRKAYLAALGLFIITIIVGSIPLLSLIVWIVQGGLSVYFIYLKYQQKRKEIEASCQTEEECIQAMKNVGGVNTWVIWVAAILNTIFIGYILFFIVALASVN